MTASVSVTTSATALGTVVGPGSATDSDFAQFDGTTGKLLKDGGLARDTDGTLAANSDSKIASQKAIKTYVDAKLAGLSWKQAVRAATTANGTLATAFANGQTIDGVTLATGDRILVKNQSTAADNGIYIVAASGAPTRSTDADAGAELVNASCYVSEGTTLADTQWTCTTNAPITVGSTSLAFAQLSAGGGSGDVVGPGSATDSDFAQFDTTTGKLLKDGGLSRDTDGTLAANSDSKIPSQKAVKTYADAGDAATLVSAKAYTDAIAQGLSIRDSCRLATTAALAANTYSNGSSGVGATLTAVSFGVLTIDGSVVALGDRILVKDEVTGSHNGIYTVTTLGALAVLYVLTRATDYDQTADIFEGTYSFIEEGTANVAKGFVLTTSGAVTVGTTALTFTQFSGAGTGVTTVSVVTANGVSGSVANPTTTPAITLALGAITPSSVNASGTVAGSNLSGTNTGDQTLSDATISTTDITTNNVSTSKHGFAPKGAGTGTQFLADDGTYKTPAGSGGGGGTGAWFNFLPAQTGTNAQNFATRGNLFTPQINITIYDIAFLLTTVNSGTYKIGIAPYNTGTNKITSAPTYTGTITIGGSAGAAHQHVRGTFSGGVALTAGTTYVRFIVRTDATSTTAMTVDTLASTVQSPGIYEIVTNKSARLASVAPATSDTWTIEGGFYTDAFAYQFT